MKIYEDFSNDIIDKATFISVLSTVQSFTFRRFILGLPTNALNKIFMGLYDKVEPNNYLFSIQKSLLQRSGVQRFPRNTETINALKEKDVYNIKPKNRTYLLERLENFQNNEPVAIEGNSDITIEHIFPQNPDAKWKIELGADEYNLIKENYLNTIGNLTLSGNNGKLSNKPFLDKKVMNVDGKEQGYTFSRLWLNRDLKEKSKWDKTEIEERANTISERFIKIWEIPKIDIELEATNDEINIFDAEDPKHKKLEYAIFFNQKLEVTQVAKLYIEVFKQLFDLQPETFFTSEIGDRLSLTKTPETSGLRQAVPISETYFIEANIDNMGKFDRIKQALTIFGFEDELSIKYAD
ncbi:HNH endonuclease family protein [Runella sp.]|uniref:HNH endonuclease family protein n=1 Tax=Runella sp. TaxID=1960881 RepID=UPI00263713DA|nr:HNH endonuclease family protein [Runella sp.]